MTDPAALPPWRRAAAALRGWWRDRATAGAPPGDGPVQVGRLFAEHYRIERLLGRGAAGALYAAIDLRDQQPVALKLLNLPTGDGAGAERPQFMQELAAAARLDHPDIVQLYSAGEHRGTAYLAMELLSGCDLSRYTRPARLLPEPVVLRIGVRLAGALAYAHRAGVLHRDLKPANVMLDLAQHQVKLTDFGIARLADAERSRSGQVVGTPAYMSPEQLAGNALDGRSDLYALGVLLFELLTGRRPHEGDTLGELLRRIATQPADDLRRHRTELPPALAELLASLLATDPRQRPADGDAVADALQHVETAWLSPRPQAADGDGWHREHRHNPLRS